MSQKKRKLAVEETERPKKKQQTGKTVKVHYSAGADVAKPVIGQSPGTHRSQRLLTITATAPGAVVPSTLKFASYAQKNTTGPSRLLLHSSDHDTIDYTAVDSNTTNSNEQHLKHYVAVFDPAAGRLDVAEARKMTVKTRVRQYQQDSESEEEDAPAPASTSRAALTEAFGSKKSKKAAATIAENRLLAGGANQDDPLAKAILSAVPDEPEPSIEEANSPQTTKPLPQANLEASTVKDAYPLSTLIVPQPAASTLSNMPIARWKHRMAKKKEVSSNFRFVAHRIIHIGKLAAENPSDSEFLENFRTLKYIEVLLQVHRYVASLGKRTIPPPEHWPEKTVQDGLLSDVLTGIFEYFFPDLRITDFDLTRLRTYILALTLRIPPGLASTAGAGILATEPSDIYIDLGIEETKGRQWFRELGCKVESAKEPEMKRWGMNKLMKATKTDGKQTSGKVKFAKLTLPLDFPKVSQGRALNAGRR